MFAPFAVWAQCPTVAPSGTGACHIGPGKVTLQASGSTGYYSWYDATGGTFYGNGTSFETPYISTTTDFYVAAANANSNLLFDGVDEYVNIGNQANLQITGDLTIEMWLKPTDFAARRNPYAKAYGGEGTITQETDGTLNFYYGTSGGNASPYQGFNSSTALRLNEWTHIAIVRDLTNGMLYWYINGVLTNSTTANYSAATAGTNPVYIGRGYVSNYAGSIDEVRVWNVARSQTDIQNNMNLCLTGSESGLVAYWQFDDNGGTTLTDSGPNGYDGILTNMEVTDWNTNSAEKSCPSCESARTAVTATIVAGTQVDLGLDRCFDVSETLDAGAGYASYLWQDGSTGQTFTVTTTGTYYVQVTDGSGCIDQDTVRLTLNPSSPTGTGGCRIGPGSVTLSASGSTGNYNWYDAATGGNYLGNGTPFNTPDITTTTDFYVAAAPVQYSLDFDGVDDYVDLGNPAELQITGDMTIEMWLKPTDFSARRNPYAKAYGGEGTITQETNGTLSYYYGTAGTNSSPYQGFGSQVALTINEWNHIAIVRDLTNGILYWYINGILTASTAANYSAATKSGNSVYIGQGYVSNYTGQIGEVRVWKTARTATEIQNNINSCCDCINNSNLVGYWDFNDGPGSTTLSDLTTNGLDGTLTNMDPANDWLTDTPPHSCESCESPRVAVTATVSAGTPVNLGSDASLVCSGSVTLDAGAGYSSYLWQDGSTAQTLTVNNGGVYWVEVQDGAGCVDQDTIVFIDGGSAGTALDFDGVDDYVDIGNPAELQITGDLTIEMWLKPTDFSARRNPYAKAYGGEGTITQETDGTVTFYYGTSGGNASPYQGFNSATALNLNEWNHIAIVRDLTNGQLYWYINGEQTNSTAASYAAAQYGGNSVYIGQGYVSNYAGQIDEVRVWNTTRTLTQIRDNMGKRLIGTETGLVAYYRMDDGAGTTLTEATLNGLNGTLTNMDPATDWVVATAPIGDLTTSLFTSSWSGQTINMTPCGRDDATVSSVAGTPTGVLLYYVGTVPNDVTGINGLGNNDRYFGVWKFNDNTATYTFVYNYTNNPHIDFSDEANLVLYSRADNAATPWTDSGATQDLVAHTFTATAQSTEFIIGSNGLPLPVTLISFTASAQRDHVYLQWQTASEINNDYFELQRATDPEQFASIAKITGAGTTTTPNQYDYQDFTAPNGLLYYRLKQTDFDGTTSYSNIVSVQYNGNNRTYLQVYPNPARSNQAVISGHNFSPKTTVTVTLFGSGGHLTGTTEVMTDRNGSFTLQLADVGVPKTGLYILRAYDNRRAATTKLIIK